MFLVLNIVYSSQRIGCILKMNKKQITAFIRKCHSISNHLFDALESVIFDETAAMLEKLCSYAKNQLPGGDYWEPDPFVKDVLSKLSPSNHVCESVLGLNDYLTSAIPNLDQAARSNLIQAKKNKSVKWLNSLPEDRQSTVVHLAVKEREELKVKLRSSKELIDGSKP